MNLQTWICIKVLNFYSFFFYPAFPSSSKKKQKRRAWSRALICGFFSLSMLRVYGTNHFLPQVRKCSPEVQTGSPSLVTWVAQAPHTTLVWGAGAAALPFLAQNSEDERTERGLRCHIEIQVQSEHDELCVGHEEQQKNLPTPSPSEGANLEKKLGQSVRFRNSSWTSGASSQPRGELWNVSIPTNPGRAPHRRSLQLPLAGKADCHKNKHSGCVWSSFSSALGWAACSQQMGEVSRSGPGEGQPARPAHTAAIPGTAIIWRRETCCAFIPYLFRI